MYLSEMKAMIFAAGLGTRLRPITNDIPKALARVGDRTLIEICIDRLYSSGYDDIVVNAHHFADKLISEIERLRVQFPKVSLHISDEREHLMDTGGAVLFAEHLLSDADSFLIHNVDMISNADLRSFHASAVEMMSSGQECDAVLLVHEAPSDRMLIFDRNMRLVGWTDVAKGIFKGPVASGSPDGKTCPDGRLIADVVRESGAKMLSFSGIHTMSRRVFSLMRNYGFSGAFPVMELYLRAAADGRVAGIVDKGLEILDVGTPEKLLAAGDFILRC